LGKQKERAKEKDGKAQFHSSGGGQCSVWSTVDQPEQGCKSIS